MNKLFEVVGAVIVATILIFLAAVFGGTVIWLIYPVAIPATFPKLVELGYLASSLT